MAERSIVLEELEDQLTCPVCLEQYVSPKTLPCLHSFCLECMHKLNVQQKDNGYFICCPTCREDVQIPTHDVADLPSAFIINNFLEIQDRLNTASQQSSQQQASSLSCSIHNDNLKVYCETCRVLICRDCTITTHKDHNYHLAEEAFPKHLKEIDAVLALLEAKVSAIAANIQALDEMEREVRNRGEITSDEVDSHVQTLIELILESQTRAKDKIGAIVGQKLQSLAQQKKEAEIALEQLQSCAEYVEQCLQHGSHQQVLKEKVKMMDSMKQLDYEVDPCKFEPRETPDVTFTRNSALLEKCKNIGFVSVGGLCSLGASLPDVAMVGRQTSMTVFLNEGPVNASLNAPPSLADAPPTPMCHVSSEANDQRLLCNIMEQGTGSVLVANFTPSSPGSHHMVIEMEDVAGVDCTIPFHVMPSPEMRGDIVRTDVGLARPMGVAVDKDGLVTVVEHGTHCITLISTEGRKTSFIAKGVKDGQLYNPRGIAITPDNHILVTDDHRVQKFTKFGKHVWSFGSRKKGSGLHQFNTPMGVAIHPITGDIYVADCYNHRIQVGNDVFSRSRVMGERGSSVHQFRYPTDVCFTSSGYLYVSDAGNHRVEVFSPDNKYVMSVGRRVTSAVGYLGTCTGMLNNPRSIVLDPHDNLYVTETRSSFDMLDVFLDSRVSCYSAKGQFLRHIGRRGDREGDFDNPSGIAMDKLGNLYISDTNNDRLVVM